MDKIPEAIADETMRPRPITDQFTCPDPFQFSEDDLTNYHDRIKLTNISLQREITRILSELHPEHAGESEQDYVVLTMGSDGRLEKGQYKMSRLEFTIVHNGISDEERGRLREAILKVNPTYTDTTVIEEKDLTSEDKAVHMYVGAPLGKVVKLISPMRVMDSKWIYGNQNMHQMVKLRLIHEIRDSDVGKKITKDVVKRRKEWVKTLSNGVQKFSASRMIRHYDLEEGYSIFNPREGKLGKEQLESLADDELSQLVNKETAAINKDYVGNLPYTLGDRDSMIAWYLGLSQQISFKGGPLRAVQYALAEQVIKKYQQSNAPSGTGVIMQAPTNTIEKILWAQKEGVVSASEQQAQDLADSYSFFLWQYNKSQQQYTNDGDMRVAFDKEAVRERLSDVKKILQDF